MTSVMRPLAAPVLGDMVSSFFHILIVTPILFAWLHHHEARPAPPVVVPARGAVLIQDLEEQLVR